MELTTNLPVASLKTVRELGLDEAQFGSCARREREGTAITLMGCPYWKGCDWKANTQHMHADDAKAEPRPRFLKYRQSKPRSRGGFSIIESYCACFQWHGDVKKLDGHNNVMMQVVGGEAAKFTTRGTKPVTQPPDAAGVRAVVHEPTFYRLEVPKFPEPMSRPELMEAIEAGMIRKEAGDQARTDEDRRRFGVTPLAGVSDVREQVTEEDVRNLVGKGTRKSA